MKTKEEVFGKVKINGILMIILNTLFLLAVCGIFAWAISTPLSNGLFGFIITLDIILFCINCLFWGGFMMIEPNEARVMTFFGKYVGTLKENGYFWVNPFYSKKKLTLRARNLDAEPIKVNDKSGNPVMIGQVLVWRVQDTYKASFDIDNMSKSSSIPNSKTSDNVSDKMKAYEDFVKVQSDAALRSVAGMYAYDNAEEGTEGGLTLRSGGEEINDILESQLNERLSIAGIEVLEARVNYLAYAPEIAAVMLRRQQADAIISAREKIVDGAVGMVKMAIDKLSESEVIELDDDKKAAMVTNLMVVLCSDEPAQPVVNSGTLYH
ncbi:SPFH domain-containing protein [Paludibacter sp. 221]|uniref:SPFH domain-containing protein n=1 Tax=Paludibacter sp. 221 TaxID=2302939 RepID=UPI0013D50C62|nr:SPFH domain-containing protein [Paludibacter sp. 221]NDV46814.1 SPFH domain-containing protein [Paludibacter sp. 221]